LQEEVKELIDNPNDEAEWADCFLLLLDAARRKGHSVDDLVKFANAKLEINKARSWKQNENGVFKHIK
jgi:predicted house-cleaning noncanonical NTP pyrophosphatase (MazG superfamily)